MLCCAGLNWAVLCLLKVKQTNINCNIAFWDFSFSFRIFHQNFNSRTDTRTTRFAFQVPRTTRRFVISYVFNHFIFLLSALKLLLYAYERMNYEQQKDNEKKRKKIETSKHPTLDHHTTPHSLAKRDRIFSVQPTLNYKIKIVLITKRKENCDGY